MSVELRPATPEDAEALADLQIAAWKEAFLPVMPPGARIPAREEFMAMGGRALAAPRVNRTVAVRSGRVVGLCTDGPSRDHDALPEVGEIRALFVHPGHWRQGVGTALAENALDHLRSSRFAEVTLWSFRDNDRANAFYERLGFRADGATQSREPFHGAIEIRYRRDL